MSFMNDTSVSIGVSPCAFRLADGGEGSDDGGDVGTGQKLLDLLTEVGRRERGAHGD